MKVVYVPHPDTLHPRYEDFIEAVDVDVDIVLTEDRSRFRAEVRKASVIVEDGGLVADAEMIEAAARAGVRLWQVTTTGLDHVDVQLFERLGVPLAHVPGRFTAPAVAEHALFLMLGLARSYRVAARNLSVGTLYEPSGTELTGKKVGLVGFGATGRARSPRSAPPRTG